MGRLLVVSNRLPFSIQRTEHGPELVPSSGGLVTALTGYLERRGRDQGELEFVWAGWPGAEVEPQEVEALNKVAREQHGAYPIAFSAADMDRFYHGFCNSTLWPLFHYFPSYATYNEEDWETYQRVNERFADEVAQIAQPGDEIWVHDYQLLLVPGLLRDRLPDATIGFFLHIPFPSFEVFRQLPTRWRRDLLRGMLGADLIGFHTHDYVQYFLRSVFRTLGHEHYLGQIDIDGVLKRVEAFPIGIDFERFWNAANGAEVTETAERLGAGLAGRKLIFSVDRLDYSKGILHRLRGYEAFLQAWPEFRGQVTFVLVVVPSREQVGQYQRMKQEMDELVGQINGSFGSVDWVPIVYQYRSLPFSELVALYKLASVALITPLRDGMNLVAKEFLASKPDGKGVLILSEMAGAARELGEALPVNPNHAREIAEAIYEALTMPEAEQERRLRPMQERVRTYDAPRWAQSFLAALGRTKENQGRLSTRQLVGAALARVQTQHAQAPRRVLLLDYDGTLVPLAGAPSLAEPDPELLQLLRELEGPQQSVYIVSGRDRVTLGSWLAQVPVRLVAEHGAWTRSVEGEWSMPKPLPRGWKEQLRPLMASYVDRVPGSALEEKDYSLAWHYRAADTELGVQRAQELADDMSQYTANLDIQVLTGKKVLEVRNAGVSKAVAAHAAREISADQPGTFVFAAGDDATDEDMFRALGQDSVSVCVGGVHSHALYRLKDFRELRALLRSFVTGARGADAEAKPSSAE